MDKKRKVIGCGVPRNRELKFIDGEKGTTRLLTYPTKGRAEAGFKVSGFYCYGVRDYLDKEYGKDWGWQDALEAVEAEIIINIKD